MLLRDFAHYLEGREIPRAPNIMFRITDRSLAQLKETTAGKPIVELEGQLITLTYSLEDGLALIRGSVDADRVIRDALLVFSFHNTEPSSAASKNHRS